MAVSLCPPTYRPCAGQIAALWSTESSPQHQHANKGRLGLYKVAKPTSAAACASCMEQDQIIYLGVWSIRPRWLDEWIPNLYRGKTTWVLRFRATLLSLALSLPPLFVSYQMSNQALCWRTCWTNFREYKEIIIKTNIGILWNSHGILYSRRFCHDPRKQFSRNGEKNR